MVEVVVLLVMWMGVVQVHVIAGRSQVAVARCSVAACRR